MIWNALDQANLIFQNTPHLKTIEKPRVYAGFDPTADSLHIGHLSVLQALRIFAFFNCEVIIVIGGFTARIGDPSGRSTGRIAQSPEIIARNAEKIKEQVMRLVPEAIVLDNTQWLEDVRLEEFLSKACSRTSPASLMTRSALSRDGLTVMEMCYPVIQGMDFVHLTKQSQTPLVQIGGSDQWGNICTGFDLADPEDSGKMHAMTVPLLVDAHGQKMGKSTGGAVWLDEEKMKIEDFWNWWRNIDDALVEGIAQRFSINFRPDETINDQKITIANIITQWVHGDRALEIEKTMRAKLKGEISGEVEIITEEKNITNLITALNFSPSKKQARTSIRTGAVRINGEKVEDPDTMLAEGIFNLTFGKKKSIIIEIKA